jgi:flagellin
VLAVQASSGTYGSDDRTALQAEFTALRTEINRIASNTQWNGSDILDGTAGTGGAVTFQVGANSSQTITASIADFSTTTVAGSIASISLQNSASVAITALDNVIDEVNADRAEMGATMNQLAYAADNLLNVKANAEASRSRVEDTDYASATTELARTQIIQQAATAMLAQANQIPQTVLALLK